MDSFESGNIYLQWEMWRLVITPLKQRGQVLNFCWKLTKYSPFSLNVRLVSQKVNVGTVGSNLTVLHYYFYCCFPGSLTKIDLFSKLGLFKLWTFKMADGTLRRLLMGLGTMNWIISVHEYEIVDISRWWAGFSMLCFLVSRAPFWWDRHL